MYYNNCIPDWQCDGVPIFSGGHSAKHPHGPKKHFCHLWSSSCLKMIKNVKDEDIFSENFIPSVSVSDVLQGLCDWTNLSCELQRPDGFHVFNNISFHYIHLLFLPVLSFFCVFYVFRRQVTYQQKIIYSHLLVHKLSAPNRLLPSAPSWLCSAQRVGLNALPLALLLCLGKKTKEKEFLFLSGSLKVNSEKPVLVIKRRSQGAPPSCVSAASWLSAELLSSGDGVACVTGTETAEM